MSRNKLISLLIKEGFSYKTLSTFTSPQLKQLAHKLIKEVDTSTVEKTTYSKAEVDKMKQDHGGLAVDGTVTPNSDGSVTVTQDIGEEEDIETDNIGNPDVEIDGKDLLRDDEELDEDFASKAQQRYLYSTNKKAADKLASS